MGALVWFLTPVGRIVGAALGLLTILGGYKAWLEIDRYQQRQIGERNANVKFERASDANARKADTVRASVETLPDNRLNDRYRRD